MREARDSGARRMAQVALDRIVALSSTSTGAIAIADVTGLQTALDGKQPAGSYAAAAHTHTKADVTDLPALASGTYTPTLTNVANLDASVAFSCQYLRVGNTVMVSGMVQLDPTATSVSTQLRMTLPIASALTATEQLAGTANCGSTAQFCAIQADPATDTALFVGLPTSTANRSYMFTFVYQIL